MLAAEENEDDLWRCQWLPWNKKPPSRDIMRLYDCVMPIEGLHLCISDALGATREYGSVQYNGKQCIFIEGGGSRILKSSLGTQAMRSIAHDLRQQQVPFLPRELDKWADGSNRTTGNPNKPPWSMPS